MKQKTNEIKSKVNLLPSRALPLVFFGPKKNCSWPNAATWLKAAKQTQNALRDRHPTRRMFGGGFEAKGGNGKICKTGIKMEEAQYS